MQSDRPGSCVRAAPTPGAVRRDWGALLPWRRPAAARTARARAGRHARSLTEIDTRPAGALNDQLAALADPRLAVGKLGGALAELADGAGALDPLVRGATRLLDGPGTMVRRGSGHSAEAAAGRVTGSAII